MIILKAPTWREISLLAREYPEVKKWYFKGKKGAWELREVV